MLARLLDSPAALAVTIAVLALVNYLIAKQTLAAIGRQTVIAVHDSPPAAVAVAGTFSLRSVMPSFGFAAVFVALTFMPSRLMRETICGGYLVLQLTTLVMNLDGLMRMRALGLSGAAEGHVRFSPSYRFRASAGQAFVLGLLHAAIAWLFGSASFSDRKFVCLRHCARVVPPGEADIPRSARLTSYVRDRLRLLAAACAVGVASMNIGFISEAVAFDLECVWRANLG